MKDMDTPDTREALFQAIGGALDAFNLHRDADLLGRLPNITTSTKMKQLRHVYELALQLQAIAISRTQLERED